MKNVKIFAKTIDEKTRNHIYEFSKKYPDCKIRIMPDCHDGLESVIGTTIKLNPNNLYINPAVVGVDIGCGVYITLLDVKSLDRDDFERLDDAIRTYVPSGRNVHSKPIADFPEINNLLCKDHVNIQRGLQSLGTLGGGNHFIEVGKNSKGEYALIIHSGSRKIGYEVAKYYMKHGNDTAKEGYNKKVKELVEQLKREGRQREIPEAIKKIPKPSPEFLSGEALDNYLHDMKIMQDFARLNRELMARTILDKMGWKAIDSFHSTHNYIDFRRMIVRKGAISAEKGEKVVIPLNMRDGTIVGIGKGVEDWNFSAPHGAGRVLGRKEAKEKLSLSEYQETMKGIFTTSVNPNTIDEAPMAYKPAQEIIGLVQDTVDIIDIYKPVYNFKAND